MVLAAAASTVLVYMLLLWLLSVAIGDPSFVDAGWGFGFVVIAVVSRVVTDGDPTRSNLIVIVTAVWGCRLGIYLLWRWRKQGRDKRYAAMLRHAGDHPHWFTLRKVFLLQGALMWIVSLPVQVGQVYPSPSGWTVTAAIGLAVAVVGFTFESVGDAQLVRFRADPASAGQVMDRGLWQYTRHPNYFGDSLVWWGLFLIAVVNVPTALTVIGPITMTYLLLRWSGVPILERGLLRRRPGYEDYMKRTSSFIPRPPKRASV